MPKSPAPGQRAKSPTHKRGRFPTAPARRKPSDYLLSTWQACDFLGISRTTLYQYVADGLITPTRLGPRMLRFDVADLEALLS
jgi:excisionase family DNA binding protein